MKLKELHKDMSRYLEEDCYYPGEIYSSDGFFYQVYEDDDEVLKLGEGINQNIIEDTNFIVCIEGKTKQILVFCEDLDSHKIVNAERYDATDNNIETVKKILNNEVSTKQNFDSFDPEGDAKSLEKLFSMADMIMYN